MTRGHGNAGQLEPGGRRPGNRRGPRNRLSLVGNYVAECWVGLQERQSIAQRQPRCLSPVAEAEIVAAR